MVTEQLLTDDKNQRNTIPGKIGEFMSKLYPIANLVLGTVTTASSVGQRPKVSLSFEADFVGRQQVSYPSTLQLVE